MLGLKLASSGSTWWAHELKAQRGIVVEEELFTSTSHLSPKKREDKMVERLARCDGGGACGFTISPKNSPGVDWRRVGRAAGCVVAWERSNLAKTVVSGSACSASAAEAEHPPGSKKADCANATAVFRVDDVEALLIEQLEWRVDFEAAVAEAVRDTPCFLRMRYEDFQRNETAELRRLRCALGLGAPDRKDRPVDVAKKTSDDLRDVIENYAEIEAYAAAVEAAAPACPLAAMLRSTGFARRVRRRRRRGELRVPSSGSSTLVHLLKHLAGESSSDCVAHGRCERVARDGGGGACGRLRFASPKAHNPGHHHFGLFEGAVGTNFAALATTTDPAGLALEDYVERAFWGWNTFTRALTGNYSGQYVAGLFHHPPSMRTREPSRQSPAELRAAMDAYNAHGADLLERAKRHLEAMPFFVLVERYDESVALLRHATCLRTNYATRRCHAHIQDVKLACLATGAPREACRPDVLAARKGNATHRACDGDAIADEATWAAVPTAALTPAVAAAAARYLALDVALYAHATRLFDARVAAMRRDRDRGIVCRLEAPLLEDPACATVCHAPDRRRRS
ncbi:hypothetical protein JL721_3265 [Aureococcus anophagefferens]|nr:hypothetical protein JL721_3265 [Aureococcus anophagefferens]